MLGNAEEGEGIGFVRPVYSFEYWNNPPAGMEWVKRSGSAAARARSTSGFRARTPTPGIRTRST